MSKTRTGERFAVRTQVSGYNGNRTFYVYDRKRQGRVSVYPFTTRETAQAFADGLNATIGWDER